MNKLFATACGDLLIAALTAGCGTARPTITAIPAGITLPSGGPVPAGFRAASVFGNGLWVTTDGGEH